MYSLSEHPHFDSAPTGFRSLAWRVLFGFAGLLVLSLLCRPTFAGVSISPEAVALSGNETARVSARIATHLPVVVDLVELSSPLQSKRQPDQAEIWSGHAVSRLTRQSDGSFAVTIDLKQPRPTTRYFQLAVRYAFLPLSRMNAADLRVAVTDRPVELPPDHGQAGKATIEGIDSDHDGVRDDLQREIVFLYPGNDEIRRVLRMMATQEQQLITTQGDHTYFKDIMVKYFELWDCYNFLAFGEGRRDYTASDRLWSLAQNTPTRTRLAEHNQQLAAPYASTGYYGPAACAEPLVTGL